MNLYLALKEVIAAVAGCVEYLVERYPVDSRLTTLRQELVEVEQSLQWLGEAPPKEEE